MLFGPMVWWELVRLARRGHAARVRILFLYALLLAIVVFAISRYRNPVPLFFGTATPIPISEIADFSRSLAFVLLEAQLLFVAVITPAYTVAAISEEKDRGTLSLLLTTSLTDREIVLGKAIARILFVLAAVLSGVPVLMLTMLLGVDRYLIAAGYALTVGTVIFSGAIGIHAACQNPDSRSALFRAYIHSALLVAVIPLGLILSPFFILFILLENNSTSLLVGFGFGYPLAQMLIGWVLLSDATHKLRQAGMLAGPPPSTEFPEPPQGRPLPVDLDSREGQSLPMGELGNGDPVLWKERHAKQHSVPWVILLTTLPAFLALALFVGGGWELTRRAMQALDPNEAMRLLHPQSGSPDLAGLMLMAAGVIALWLYLLPVAIGVTGSIAGERLRGTLDSLLATRLDRRRILWAKIQTHAEQGLVFAGGAAAALGAGFGADGGVEFGFAVIAAFAGGIALIVGLGVWLSVRCATPTRAFRICLPAIGVVGCMPMLAWYFTDWENPAPMVEALAWTAAMFLLLGVALFWRAGVELERGE